MDRHKSSPSASKFANPTSLNGITYRKLTLFVLGIVLLVGIDLSIKAWVETHWVRTWTNEGILAEGEQVVSFANDPRRETLVIKEVHVIDNFWSFIYVRNYNIGFSLLGFIENFLPPSAQIWFFRLLQLVGIIVITSYFFYRRMMLFPVFTLIIGGGLGNVIDRWYRGYVVDYVKWYIPNSPIDLFNPWPIFNFADSMVSVGAVSLIVLLLFFPKYFEPIPTNPTNQTIDSTKGSVVDPKL